LTFKDSDPAGCKARTLLFCSFRSTEQLCLAWTLFCKC